MDNNLQSKMAADIAPFRLPRYAQIPDIGLYLEQVVRYVNAYLAPLGEPELSPSMVSNYVKQRLIPAPQKKGLHGRAARTADVHCRGQACRPPRGTSPDVWHTGGQLCPLHGV